MSWSVSAVGKAAAVRKAIAEQIARIRCSEPEETIKNGVAQSIDVALAAFPQSSGVDVTASGSQSSSSSSSGGAGDGHVNSLSVSIKPIYGYVE